MHKVAPFFSICVPTKNRAQFLKLSLQSVLSQDFCDYEVIVSDNNSSDETASLCRGIQSSALRYVYSACDLTMSENFDNCLKHISGQYVIFIGDDDLLVPNALSNLYRLLAKYPNTCVTQEDCLLSWTCAKTSTGDLSINYPLISSDLRIHQSFHWYQKSLKRLSYILLPTLYHGCIPTSCLNLARSVSMRENNFHAAAPDVYISIVLSLINAPFITAPFLFSIKGSSSVSNGGSGGLPISKRISMLSFLKDKKKYGMISESCGQSELHETYLIALNSMGLSKYRNLAPSFATAVYQSAKISRYSPSRFTYAVDNLKYLLKSVFRYAKQGDIAMLCDVLLALALFPALHGFFLFHYALHSLLKPKKTSSYGLSSSTRLAVSPKSLLPVRFLSIANMSADDINKLMVACSNDPTYS